MVHTIAAIISMLPSDFPSYSLLTCLQELSSFEKLGDYLLTTQTVDSALQSPVWPGIHTDRFCHRIILLTHGNFFRAGGCGEVGGVGEQEHRMSYSSQEIGTFLPADFSTSSGRKGFLPNVCSFI